MFSTVGLQWCLVTIVARLLSRDVYHLSPYASLSPGSIIYGFWDAAQADEFSFNRLNSCLLLRFPAGQVDGFGCGWLFDMGSWGWVRDILLAFHLILIPPVPRNHRKVARLTKFIYRFQRTVFIHAIGSPIDLIVDDFYCICRTVVGAIVE